MSYQFNSKDNRGIITINMTGRSFEARRWVVEHIGEICSNKNVTMIAGKESRENGRYRVLNESLEDGLLTIEFQAVY